MSKDFSALSGFSRRDGALYCEELNLRELAQRFGTPLYVYSHQALKTALENWMRGIAGTNHRVFYAMIAKHDIIKIVIGMGLTDYGINLMIVSIGFNEGGTAPIYTFGELVSGMYFVDPVPQALTLTSIVIGACVTAMALALCVRLYNEYGTLDSREIRRLHG